jgi:hypothetical protein
MMHGRIAKAAAAAGLALALCGGVAACGSGSNGTSTTSGGTSTTVPRHNGGSSPAPQPSGMPVCGDLTEIVDDLTTLQNGPAYDAPQELQAIEVQLSKVVAGTSQQSSDLSALDQDFNTTVTDSSGGTDLDPTPVVNGSISMDDDLNALASDCAGS